MGRDGRVRRTSAWPARALAVFWSRCAPTASAPAVVARVRVRFCTWHRAASFGTRRILNVHGLKLRDFGPRFWRRCATSQSISVRARGCEPCTASAGSKHRICHARQKAPSDRTEATPARCSAARRLRRTRTARRLARAFLAGPAPRRTGCVLWSRVLPDAPCVSGLRLRVTEPALRLVEWSVLRSRQLYPVEWPVPKILKVLRCPVDAVPCQCRSAAAPPV